MTASAQRSVLGVFVAGVVAWLVTAVLLWSGGAPLGDNEALYARAAQLQLDGVHHHWDYLSRGMIAVAAPGVLAGGSERALRFVPVLLGVAFVLAAALLARRAMGDAVAAWLVAVMAASLSIVRRSADLLSDLPAAACLLAGLAVLIAELERDDGPRWRIVLAAPAFAAALYLRYGSCIPISIIGIAALGFGWRAVRRRPARLLATLALFLALLVPHALEAWASTGSPLGFLLAGNAAIQTEHGGAGLVGYVANNPFTYYGAMTAPLMLLGLLSIVRPRDRRAVMLWLIAVADIIAIGMTAVAESRYIFLPIVLLLVLGIDAAHRWIAARPPRLRRALAAAAAIALAASWLGIAISSARLDARRRAHWGGMLTAADLIRRDAAGTPCEVVARHTSQVEWYSGCEALLEVPPLGQERVYYVRDDFGDYQPAATGISGHPRALIDRPDVLVLRLDP